MKTYYVVIPFSTEGAAHRTLAKTGFAGKVLSDQKITRVYNRMVKVRKVKS